MSQVGSRRNALARDRIIYLMKRLRIAAQVALLSLLTGGCGHLDLTPEGKSDRVVVGSVDFGNPIALPADSVVVVRVVDATRVTETSPAQVIGSPSVGQKPVTLPPKVLGEQIIRNPGQAPVPFRIEYTAMDEQLRHGINIEARVSFGGRVRYFNLDSVAITLNNLDDARTITVNRLN